MRLPSPSSRVRARLALAALLLCGAATALITSGCGASAVIDPVANAATVSNSAPGYRMVFTVRLGSPSLPIAMTGTGTGSVDTRDHAGSADFAFQLPNLPQITQALGSDRLRMREITQGTTFYLKMPAAIAGKLPGGRPWLKVDLGKQAASMGMPGLGALSSASPLSSDPSQFLQYLRAVSGGVSKVGTGTVAGHQTTEYQATIDLEKVADRVPAANRAAARRSIQHLEQMTHVRKLPVHLWIDGQHLVRRMTMNMNMSLPTGQAIAMAMQVTIPQYGPQPLPKLPPASQVTDATSLAGAAAGSPA